MLHGKAPNCSLSLFLIIDIILAFVHAHSYPSFSRDDTEFQHLVLHPDPSMGKVYVGAKDHLFQLDGLDGLRLEQEEKTGPVSDSKDCIPPVTESNCPQARRTSNYNKLLLVDPNALELITCGSVYQGTCQKRSLASISEVLFSTERPVDTQYVAANDPSVSTVGLVVGLPDGERTVMYVGRGYTASQPPISTRHLSFEPLFSYEETAKLAVAGRLSEYDHHFVTTFTRQNYVYFLFYRRDIKSSSREYQTYVARVCLDDTSYYSYVEVPLVCRSSSSRVYNLLQAAQVGHGRDREGEDLLGVFSTRVSSANQNPLDGSALCVFSLDELDKHIDTTRDLCYTQHGMAQDGGEVAYIEYEVKSSCANLPMNTLQAYPCGSDHTPSPMASRVPLEAKVVWQTLSTHLTAVAVNIREDHSIAFLGDSKGTLHKVYLGQDGQVEVYANATIQPNSPINSDLLLDQKGTHIYIMTKDAVEKRPVAECGDHLDCQSCLSANDPYCGWCVLEGRCGQRWECRRGSEKGQWLWSFNQTQQCLSIQHLSLYNISRGEKTDITVSVDGLPSLGEGEAYSCFFHDTETPAVFANTGVVCPTPDASSLPRIERGDEFVMVILSLRFLNVTVAETEFTLYDCSLVQELSGRRPCQRCVSSRWGCNWCIHEHVCTHRHTCSQGVTIYNQNDCPCVEKVQESSLLPVNVERKITLVGRHLHLFQDENLDYECMLDIENRSVVVEASVEPDDKQQSVFLITCKSHEFAYSVLMEEYPAEINVRRKDNLPIDSADDLFVTLFNCAVGRSDCSRCRTADPKYGCVWCGGPADSHCVYHQSCTDDVNHTCPAPVIHFLDPVSGPIEGGTLVTISGSNLGQRAEDIQNSVTVAGVSCSVINSRYEVSSRIVCETTSSDGETSGQASVRVRGGALGWSDQTFSFKDPTLTGITPQRGPKAGGSSVTIKGHGLKTGHPSDVNVLIGGVPCMVLNIDEDQICCQTRGSNRTGRHSITVRFGGAERHLQGVVYHYTPNPNITRAAPSRSFLSGGRIIRVSGQNLDVVQEPKMRVTLSPPDSLPPRRRRSISQVNKAQDQQKPLKRRRRIVPEVDCSHGALCHVKQYESRCTVNSSSLILCPTPAVGPDARRARVKVHFLLDSLHFDFNTVGSEAFSYEPNPKLYILNRNDPDKPYHHKPGSIISVEGENLDLAIYKHEVEARIGQGICSVKTLTHNHLYCEPPAKQPSVAASQKKDVMDSLPEFTVKMGNLNFSLGRVQYDSQAQSIFPLEAQVGVGVGASIVALIVVIIVLIYRRKSKQAMRDYKKVQIQLENLETSVRDRCKKEFTDLMTEMMDMSSDLVGSGIPFLDYRAYAERIFFPGHQESPLRRDLDVPESRRQTVEQGLVQLSNLLNSKLFLTKFIHTLEAQQTFSPRDRAYVASLLTVALHGKLEYFTDILKTLLNDLVEQYVAKNPKLMLRRTESVVEKLLTNWMSICLFNFLRESAGESFYMLFRAIKHQVDKGPVDAVTGKAKYTLNDNRLLREDVEYRSLTLNVVMPSASGGASTQTMPAKVLDCDTITQVKEKLLDQTWKGTSITQRPHADSLHLEWRSGVAGHLILSDEDLTSVVQGSWKRLNTLQHYKVPDGSTVALVPRNAKNHLHDSHDYMPGEKTPMLDDGEEGGIKLWHLVKASEELELPKHRRGSMREKGGERAKAIPEIYLTRLLSMKGTLQKFVDDLFTAILSTSRPVPLAVKYFFDLLDEQALLHNITDPETIHIWKTNSLPLRFWINILKNPQFIFNVQTSDHVDAVLFVIAQTFMDSCTIADHKLGRDSPINKLLYARDIPRYKQMVERYYADIRQTISASDQEMNSALAELSRNYAGEVNFLMALHELYKYINKYYDQIITALEEDCTAQKMQLGYRLQQIAAAVENKVTDL
ncbi:plexin-B1-like isoform X2 [Dunckerocampus dactyliophorus]|uniref:plexin-B1-like isoform X2 n=1 Tax=Dunckerocampus dactyliophorus TaxID=161453 RepID=UPI002405C9AD|nr:plexin-B1-like isoform X2 [Dunckerocampus dactyliophorus]